jgi:hypothetical protein
LVRRESRLYTDLRISLLYTDLRIYELLTSASHGRVQSQPEMIP